MVNKSKYWCTGFFVLVVIVLVVIGMWTIKVDPFFHYHKPYAGGYFYSLDNQRSQNNGITKYFEYEGMIIGTSMTENFKTSEAEAIYGCSFIKTPYSGGSWKEMNDSLKVALENNDELKIIIRGLDMGMFFYDKDYMREDLGTFPTYLYDDNIFNDVEYVFNRDVIFTRVYPMVVANDKTDFRGGITSFDEYSNWMTDFTFGVNTLFAEGVNIKKIIAEGEFTQEECDTILKNVQQNVTALATEYPDVTFYYFFTPYSAAWWQSLEETETIEKQIQAEKIIIEEILKYDNIKLYSFNGMTEIITDLNNYKDTIHYGEWINSLMLRYMHDEKCLITSENYEEYLEKELEFYSSYDYSSLINQEDYKNDYYAAALLNEEINGVKPLYIDFGNSENIEISNAEIVDEQYDGKIGLLCKGSIQREAGNEYLVSDYLRDEEYIGFKYTVDDITPYKYLVFYGKKISDHGQPSVYIYDKNGNVIERVERSYHAINEEWDQYLVDISKFGGEVEIIFNGGYIDNTGSPDSQYVFSDITLY